MPHFCDRTTHVVARVEKRPYTCQKPALLLPDMECVIVIHAMQAELLRQTLHHSMIAKSCFFAATMFIQVIVFFSLMS
jgi:hypothetical protein